MSRRHLRVIQGTAVVAACTMALTACGSSSHQQTSLAADYSYGSLPAAADSMKDGGTLTIAEPPGAGPNWIFPITPSANASVFSRLSFQYLSWRPVYWAPKGSSPVWDYSRSMSDGKPTVSADGKTFTIKLNGRYTWSDGQKVTSKDILFFYYLYKAAVKENPANENNYTPGQFPDNITAASAPDDQTVTFSFDKVYNPDFVQSVALDQLVALPSHAWSRSSADGATVDFTQPDNAKAIYDFLDARSKSVSTYGTDPLWQVVDGPYKIKTFNASTSANSFVANTAYTGEGRPRISEVDELAYTSTTAEFNDLLSGKLTIGGVDFEQLPQIQQLKARKYNVYGLPDFGNMFMYFNFKNTANGWDKAISQLYIRQAFAHLQDGDAEIKGAFDGAAAPAYGPVGVVPKSPYAPSNALTDPYPFSVDKAKQLLTSHGWTVVPNGTTTCTSPGSGADQCGAGIARGQNLDFTFYYANSPKATAQIATTFAANLEQVGVHVTLKSDTFNNIIANESVPSSPKNNNDWGMADFGGMSNNNYPTTDNLFNTDGTYNQGGFSDPTIDADINASMNSTDSSALTKELSDVTNALPVLFQPAPDMITAWAPNLSGDPDAFAASTQYMFNPEDMYFTR